MKKHNKKERIPVLLSREELSRLEAVVKRGREHARVITRARILLLSHKGKMNQEIRNALGCGAWVVTDMHRRYRERGSVEAAIHDAPRPGQPKKITAEHEAFVIATACTPSPEGHAHWTLEALKVKLLETYLDIDSVSCERIRQMLIRAELKPWREKMWCVPRLTPKFRERMDDILALYTDVLPEGHEVHCFDETPKQLLSTPRGGNGPKPRKPGRIDYEYKRNGRVNIFVAVAPFMGKRTVSVTKRRTAEDTADFLWRYCMEEHADAVRIHLVLDNLNTHKEKLLRAVWGEERADRFFSRVTLHFTPYHASWLNMAELEINALKTQGLKRRIGSELDMRRSADAIVTQRNTRKAAISWSFTKTKAREKFPMLYVGN